MFGTGLYNNHHLCCRCLLAALAFTSAAAGGERALWAQAPTVLPAVSAAPAAAQAQTVSGIVRGGPNNAPIAGATVVWYGDYDGTWNKAAPLPTTTTDAAGRWTIVIPPAQFADLQVIAGSDSAYRGTAVVAAPKWGVGSVSLTATGDNALVLFPAVSAHGVVVGGGSGPVVGARVGVDLVISNGDGPFSATIIPPPLQSQFSVVTDKNGAWEISGLPPSGKAIILVEKKNGATARLETPLSPSATPIKAGTVRMQAAVLLSGRVVDENHKPVAGVRVEALGTRTRTPDGSVSRDDTNFDEATSDANGNVSFFHLAPGVVTLRVPTKPDALLVAAALPNIKLLGPPVVAPPLVLTPGGLITGTVVDADTNEPLGGVTLGGNGPHLPKAAGGGGVFSVPVEGGTFTLRVPPGKTELYLMGVPTGYLHGENGSMSETPVSLLAGQTKTVAFRVRKGRVLSGTVLDENNKPASGVSLRVSVEWDDRQAVTDASGAFQIPGLPLTAQKLPVTVEGDWATVSPASAVIALSDAKTPLAPITLHIKHAARRQITGRVLTPKNEPVEGVTVRASIRIPIGEEGSFTYTTREAVSDATGVFAIPNIPPSPEINLSGERVGYRWLSGGLSVPPTSTVLTAQAVMTPLTHQVEGVVVGGESGAPVGNATVFAPESTSGLAGRVQTDAKGHFVLSGLPENVAAQVAAFTKTGYGTGVRAANQTGPIVVTLEPAQIATPAPDVSAATDLLTEIRNVGKGKPDNWTTEGLAALLARADGERALAWAETNGLRDDWQMENLLTTIAACHPDEIKEVVLPRLGKLQTEAARLQAAGAIILQAPQNALPPGFGEKTYRELVALIAADPAPANLYNASSRFLRAAALAGRLQHPDEAKAWLDKAIEAGKAAQTGVAIPDWWGAEAEEAARSGDGGVLVRLVLKQTPPDQKADAYGRAIPVLAQSSPSAAAQLLGEMNALPRPTDGRGHYNYDMARLGVVRAQAKTTPTLALGLARDLGEENKPFALALVASQLPIKNAAPIFREAFDAAQQAQNMGASGVMALVAAMAWEQNPALGGELFRDARAHLTSDDWGLPMFAYYYARCAPAEARVLLEGAWASALGTGDTSSVHFEDVASDLVKAMLPLSVARAKEMAQKVPDHQATGAYNPRADLLHQIAAYLAADAQTRRTTRFENWNRSEQNENFPWQ